MKILVNLGVMHPAMEPINTAISKKQKGRNRAEKINPIIGGLRHPTIQHGFSHYFTREKWQGKNYNIKFNFLAPIFFLKKKKRATYLSSKEWRSLHIRSPCEPGSLKTLGASYSHGQRQGNKTR